MKKIDFMLTAFRDGLQSAYGARVFSKDYLPIVKACAEAGIGHFESGGGALFQSSFFYCNENAFDVMDAFREAAGPSANLQTLARGINVVGLDSQSSDVIRLHAQLFKKHGVTTIRNFDALNDVQNLIYSGQCIVEAGLKHEIAITMMDLPPGSPSAHTSEFYLHVLKEVLDADIPYHSLCFKDATGTARPRMVYETIKAARKLLGQDARIVFHTHETAGTGTLCYVSAIEAGADQVDLSMAPLSGGTSQPDIVTLWHALRGSDYSLDVDIHKIIILEEMLKEALADYMLPPEATRVEPLIPFFPMPGGALTANTQMLRDNNMLDKYPEVVTAMGDVVAKGGFGTAVTPVSQFYFQQAFNNVLYGPWKRISEGYGKIVLGYFGKTPLPPDPEVVRIAQQQLNLAPTTDSPLALNDRNPNKGLAAAAAMLESANLKKTDENLFIAATCLDKGILFLKGKAKPNVRKISDAAQARDAAASSVSTSEKPADAVTVMLGNKAFAVKFSKNLVIVNGTAYSFQVKDGIDAEAVAKTATLPKASELPGVNETRFVESSFSGRVVKVQKKAGDKVAVGETVLIVNSMGIEIPINSPYSGIIQTMFIMQGDMLEMGTALYRVNTIAHGTVETVARAAEALTAEQPAELGGTAMTQILSPIAGLVLRIYKEPGEKISIGESLLVMESMKMERPVNSTVAGVIEQLLVKQGDLVDASQVLAIVRL
ncbi:MAG: biotin/lipoyl-containing protein [Rectinema subterraneum]